jgi:serine/threonine protein kinase
MYSLEDIKQRTGPPRTVPIACVDGGPLPSNIPTQAIEAAFEGDIDPSAFSGPMKISDFGDAFFASDPPHMTSKLGPYIVPEYASPAKMSPKIDVWLLGCATYQIISGHDLFGIPDDSPELVTRRMMETLGRPPDFLVRDWEAQIGHSIEVLDKPVENKSLRSRVMDIRDGNTERGMKARENEFSAGDVQTLTELLESLLKFDPDDRPDIEQVLKHAAMDYFRLQTLEDSLN